MGSGPNGLAAAITLAQAGCHVTVLEAEPTIGGGTRSAALTLPGFTHDVCSAIHPLGIASPFFRSLPLDQFGLEWIHPPAPLAHPLDDGSAVLLHRSLDATTSALGPDGAAYRRLFAPLIARCDTLLDATLRPLLPPRHPLALARFGWLGMHAVHGLARSRFKGVEAQALFGGIGAHSILPLDAPFSASFALMLGMLAHHAGWPFPRGGSQAIADALAAYLRSLGGEIVTSHRVASVGDLPPAAAVFFDLSPQQVVTIASDRLPVSYRQRLKRFRHGPGAFKLDWALDGPIPWRAAGCAQAATVHLGGTIDGIVASERAATHGQHAERPFVLLTQPGLFDPTRAPPGKQTAWAYCHVPNGSDVDMTMRIEAQVERFAPGFGSRILARHVTPPAELERHNANYIGGDIVGGANDIRQIIARPTPFHPYTIPVKGWYLCSASAPPGGGVHGMAGFNAAKAALRAGV